ncbi:MAG: beta-lactamase family protein [Acidimicrobiia bacterium]|nr:beta-lactamase family protein [Acidimicrobiia bacterium]
MGTAAGMRTLAAGCIAVLLAASCGGSGDEAPPSEESTHAGGTTVPGSVVPTPDYEALGAELDELRELLLIPGMSAAVVHDQELVWTAGFGHADIDGDVPAGPDTPFHLASVTKPVASTMLMQLVEEGVLDLEDPVADFGVELENEGEGAIQVQHLLTHTSSGVPGDLHDYDGNRFAFLGAVAESATGIPFTELMFDRILQPAGMTHSAGGDGPACNAVPTGKPIDTEGEQVRALLARPYQLDLDYRVVESLYPEGYSPAAGLVASVTDIAAFDIALDRGELVGQATVDAMFEQVVPTAPPRQDLAYGLGWYSQTFDDTRLVWHSGRWPPSVSALYLKVPDHDLTFIAAGNTPNLTTPFPLGRGDVMSSALALSFYRHVLYERMHHAAPPDIDWTADESELAAALTATTDPDGRRLLQRELWARRQATYSVGLDAEFDRLDRVYAAAFPGSVELSRHLARASDTPRLADGVELSPAELEMYVGTYTVDMDESIWPPDLDAPPDPVKIELRNSELEACAADSPPSPLVPLGNHEFQGTGGPSGSFVVTAIVEDGDVEGLRVPFGAEGLTERVELVYRRASG